MKSRKRWTETAFAALLLFDTAAHSTESVCHGSPAKGRLENGVALPLSGTNFRAYSAQAEMLNRNFVHSRIATVVTDAYARLAVSHPELTFVYGETGHRSGGPMPPHRTHQNGLSVDFMVPLRDSESRSVAMPTHAGNLFGYNLEFDADGQWSDYRIDFEAIAEHLHALDQAAKAYGLAIAKVIFDPPYLKRLFATQRGKSLKQRINFVQRAVWIRHDEHYHVDFALPCR